MTAVPRELARIRDTLRDGRRVLLTSHARPDGDSLGSQLALGEALDQIGTSVRIVNSDAAPGLYDFLPGLSRIEVTRSVEPPDVDALVVLECGSLSRTEVAGLAAPCVINIDHHLGNTMFGDINWHDASACACGELVFELIDALGARLTPPMATQLYVTILTDTGSFRHGHISARTFEFCRRIAETGVDPAAIASSVYNNGTIGRLRLSGMLLDRMTLHDEGRIAVMSLSSAMLETTGCAPDDLEGIVNMPLAARDIRAVVFLRETEGELRVSLRSKDEIDVREVAMAFGGGGHRNAAGLTLPSPTAETRSDLLRRVAAAITEAEGAPGTG